jgi:hypothetical protein
MRVITVFLMLMMSMVTMASQLNDTIIVVQDSAKIAKEEEAKKKVHQYRYRVEHLMLSDLLDRFNNRKIVVDAFVDFDWMKENLEKMDSTFVFEWDKMSYEIRKKGKFIFIIYKFPKPNCMPEALYGIIAINKKLVLRGISHWRKRFHSLMMPKTILFVNGLVLENISTMV